MEHKFSSLVLNLPNGEPGGGVRSVHCGALRETDPPSGLRTTVEQFLSQGSYHCHMEVGWGLRGQSGLGGLNRYSTEGPVTN